MTTCQCGCGATVTPGRRWRAGHNPKPVPRKRLEDYPAPVPDGTCLRWRGPHHSHGYGLVSQSIEPSGYAHRMAWRLAYGPIPDGLVIDHVTARGCRFKDCINVDHMEPVPQLENARRGGWGMGDWGQAAKLTCPAGHPYDDANTYHYTRKDGTQERHCRACHQEAKRRYRARQKDRLA